MRRVAGRAVLALAAPILLGAAEPRLVPDVSDTKVAIAYSFTGADLLLFGAIVYPDGQAPAHPPDIAVVVKGPAEPLLVREKAKVAGIWMNGSLSRRPDSISRTLCSGFSERRLASTQPAEPPPMMM